MNYPYSQINLLEEPHNYMYTSFQGHELLESYCSSRMSLVQRYFDLDGKGEKTDYAILFSALRILIPSLTPASLEIGNKINKLLEQVGINKFDMHKQDAKHLAWIAECLQNTRLTETINTLNLLRALNASLLNMSIDENKKIWLDRMVQRFEVTKKIYDFYPPGFRKGEGGNTSVRLYWLFSLALCLFYIQTKKIKYLSTLLKVCDLLCSLPETQLQEYIPKYGLSGVLLTELVCVEELARNKGVSIAPC